MEYYGALHYQCSFWKIIRHLTLILTYFCLVTLETAAMQLWEVWREEMMKPRRDQEQYGLDLLMRFAARVSWAVNYGRNLIFS